MADLAAPVRRVWLHQRLADLIHMSHGPADDMVLVRRLFSVNWNRPYGKDLIVDGHLHFSTLGTLLAIR